jgi:hypothetical protein
MMSMRLMVKVAKTPPRDSLIPCPLRPNSFDTRHSEFNERQDPARACFLMSIRRRRPSRLMDMSQRTTLPNAANFCIIHQGDKHGGRRPLL